MSKVKKDKIEAQGFSIEVYTEDYMNDYISLTDIAKYKNEDDPRFVIQNWMRNRNTLEFIGLWEILNNENFNRVQFDTFKMEAGLNIFTMTPQNGLKARRQKVSCQKQVGFKYASEADMLNVAMFDKTTKEWREENKDLKGNMRDYASLNELLVLENMESFNAILIEKSLEQKERMIELRKLARNQMLSLEKLNKGNLKQLEDKKK